MRVSPEGRPRFTGRLFVACANTNSVLILGLSEGNTLSLLGRVGVGPSELAPLGSTPTALALSPDGKRLYVATQTGVAVVDIEDYEAELAGFLPAAPAATGNKEADDKATADYQKNLTAWKANKKARDEAWARWQKILAGV